MQSLGAQMGNRQIHRVREMLARLSSLLSLTKQERAVAIFLVISLAVGNSILFIRRRKADFAQDLIIRERFTVDQLIDQSDSLVKAKRKYLRLNINTATSAELELLPGIGEATAERIINYRDRFGRFRNREDIMNVKGIGKMKYQAIKNCIAVDSQNERSFDTTQGGVK